jgi:hypothetical protein
MKLQLRRKIGFPTAHVSFNNYTDAAVEEWLIKSKTDFKLGGQIINAVVSVNDQAVVL